MRFKVIFIAGVHGVGKGTICEEITTYLGYPIYSASDLIRQEKDAAVDQNKIVIDADKNQDHLVVALSNLIVDTDFIIVDGHFCLQGKNTIIDVPLETYQRMDLVGIVLLIDDPIAIHGRLYSRDGISLTVEMLRSLQEREKERAVFVADNLKIPILETCLEDKKRIIEWIASSCILK